MKTKEKNEIIKSNDNEKQHYQEIKDFSLSYNKILNSSNNNKIDEKLFNMVNIDIENLFE